MRPTISEYLLNRIIKAAFDNLGYFFIDLPFLQLGIVFMKSPDQGGDTIVYAALSPGMWIQSYKT